MRLKGQIHGELAEISTAAAAAGVRDLAAVPHLRGGKASCCLRIAWSVGLDFSASGLRIHRRAGLFAAVQEGDRSR